MNNGGFLEILLGDLRMVRMGEMEISVFWRKTINKKVNKYTNRYTICAVSLILHFPFCVLHGKGRPHRGRPWLVRYRFRNFLPVAQGRVTLPFSSGKGVRSSFRQAFRWALSLKSGMG